mmetsp:Transcript_93432/g.213651  ORF Transcript_93432/g.213651 Transcript_93432/m.213651 type:complete len:200 (-) Transcript_93432:125-724(-)
MKEIFYRGLSSGVRRAGGLHFVAIVPRSDPHGRATGVLLMPAGAGGDVRRSGSDVAGERLQDGTVRAGAVLHVDKASLGCTEHAVHCLQTVDGLVGLFCLRCLSPVYAQSRIKHWWRKTCVKVPTDHCLQIGADPDNVGGHMVHCSRCGGKRMLRGDRMTPVRTFVKQACRPLEVRASRGSAARPQAKRQKTVADGHPE